MFHKSHLKKGRQPNAIQIFILKNEIAYRRKRRHLWAGLQSLCLEVPSSNDRFTCSTLGDDFPDQIKHLTSLTDRFLISKQWDRTFDNCRVSRKAQSQTTYDHFTFGSWKVLLGSFTFLFL